MLSFSSIFGFALLLGAAKGSPTPLEALDQLANQRTFSIEQVEVDRKEPRTLLDEITRTYLKYDVEPPSYVEAAIRDGPAGGQASAPAKSIGGDKEYLMSVKVGNHNLTLDLDTGSADLYVYSSQIITSYAIPLVCDSYGK
jgi:aspergillopepsin I